MTVLLGSGLDIIEEVRVSNLLSVVLGESLHYLI
jgi:hypothetical protein